MAKIAAPSARALLAQATLLWPYRRRASDGIVPSAAHTAASPNSDHEPGAAGYCHAVDLTHDPANGCDCAAVSETLRLSGDPRRKYIIFNRRICSPPTWEWRPYSGSNPHSTHMHMSIIDTKAACENTNPWPLVQAKPKEEPVVNGQWWIDFEGTPAQRDAVAAVAAEMVARGGAPNRAICSVRVKAGEFEKIVNTARAAGVISLTIFPARDNEPRVWRMKPTNDVM